MRHFAAPMRALAVLLLAGCQTAAADHARSSEPPITLAFAGDVMFGRFVPDGFRAIEAERRDPFASIAPRLAAADLTIVNLETPVMEAPPPESRWGTRMRFVATPPRIATLAGAGVDIVSLANNHHYDMRTAGVAETPGLVAAAGLTAIGEAEHESPIRVETVHVRGKKVAMIAATAVRNGEQREGEPLLPHVDARAMRATLEPLVRAARDEHDLVVAVLHWGTEYADAPARWQIDCARALIDAGADLIIGHHPHVLQAIEQYRGGLIAYSLGNFLFDNTTEIPRLSGVLTVSIDDHRCLSARFDPAMIRRHPVHHVEATPGRRGRLSRDRVRTLSAAKPHRTPWRDDGDALVLERVCPIR